MRTLIDVMLFIAIIFRVISFEGSYAGNETKTKLKMSYLIPWTGQYPIGKTMGPVILQALDNVKNRGLLLNYDIELHWRDTKCDKRIGVKMLIDIWRDNQDLDVIIGDACSEICYQASMLASVWNIPIISFGCTLQVLSDKSAHPTFSRLMRPSSDKVQIMRELVIMFGWKRVGIISDSLIAYQEQSKQLFSELRLINATVFYYNIISVANNTNSKYGQNNMKNVLKSIKEEVRVLIIYAYGFALEEMSLLSKGENMEKEYVFIVVSDNAFNTKNAKYYPNWLTLTIAMPHFDEEDLVLDFNDPLFNGMTNSSSSPGEEGFSFAGKYFFSHSMKYATQGKYLT